MMVSFVTDFRHQNVEWPRCFWPTLYTNP